MDFYDFFYQNIFKCVENLAQKHGITIDENSAKFVVESPKNENFGDISTNVAMALPIKLVIERPSLINLSTPHKNPSPSSGIEPTDVNVEANTTNPLPVTPAAPFEVTIKMPNNSNISLILSGTLYN
jgi:hypothetical protein